jgi:hypothetical protein
MKARRASTRALVGTAEHGISLAKANVHRVTGTLSRSLHTAGRNYQGESDYEAAKAADLQNGSVTTSQVSWEGDTGVIWAGSWIPYAVFEESLHPFLGPAFDVAREQQGSLLQKAFHEEGF